MMLTLSAFLACYSCAKNEADMADDKPAPQLAAERLAKETLAKELNIEGKDIKVMRSEAVDWPNPGLGCPDPDTFYPQVIVPGFKVVLQVNDTSYPVHVGSDQAKICQP